MDIPISLCSDCNHMVEIAVRSTSTGEPLPLTKFPKGSILAAYMGAMSYIQSTYTAWK